MEAGRTTRPGPLVEPGPALSADALARAERQLALPGFDDVAQRRLRNARVLVIGAGGLGSASVPYLAGAGVGTIGLVDDDTVELSNLHRQIAHGIADLGRAKTGSLADTVHALDPSIEVIEHRERLTSANALEVCAGYDLIIDGSDNFPTRYLTNDAAQLLGKPLIWGAILQYHGQVSVAWHAFGPGYRDLFPLPPAPGEVPSCAVGGVLPGLCGTVGTLLATEALKAITGIGDLLIGRVLSYDALAARTREIPYGRDPEAHAVTELIDYELFCRGGEQAPALLTAEALAAEMSGGEPPMLIDVRTPEEYAESRIRGSILLPLADIEAGAEIPPHLTGVITIHCARDPRSIRAATLLAARGLPVRYLRGGIVEFAGVAPELVETHPAQTLQEERR